MNLSNQYLYNLTYQPAQKALEFYASGLTARQRMWLGGVRSLKTSSVLQEVAMHVHGQYQSWWPGYKYDRPTRWLVGTIKAQKTRDVLQKYLLQGDKQFGLMPFLHQSLIVDTVKASGLPNAIDRLYVKHVSGGVSEIKFVSFAEGATGLQSETFDGAHLDEAPDADVYNEVLYRTTAFGNYKTFVLLTMWPEHGRDDLVDFFMNKGSAGESVEDHFYMHSSWADNPYMTEEEKIRLRAATPAYLLEAREHGIPIFGVGKVFTMKEEDILIDPFEIPPHFKLIYGIDPSATSKGYWGGVLLAEEPSPVRGQRGATYVIRDYKMSGVTMSEHHDNLLGIMPDWCFGVCDPAGGGEETTTRESAIQFLQRHRRTIVKAEKANKRKEVTIGEIEILARSGKFKIFKTCKHYIDEFRRYSRDDKGVIIKENDHCLDASFYALDKIGEYGKSLLQTQAKAEERSYMSNRDMYKNSWMGV